MNHSGGALKRPVTVIGQQKEGEQPEPLEVSTFSPRNCEHWRYGGRGRRETEMEPHEHRGGMYFLRSSSFPTRQGIAVLWARLLVRQWSFSFFRKSNLTDRLPAPADPCPTSPLCGGD